MVFFFNYALSVTTVSRFNSFHLIWWRSLAQTVVVDAEGLKNSGVSIR